MIMKDSQAIESESRKQNKIYLFLTISICLDNNPELWTCLMCVHSFHWALIVQISVYLHSKKLTHPTLWCRCIWSMCTLVANNFHFSVTFLAILRNVDVTVLF